MKTMVIILILFCCGASHIKAQSDYLIATSPTQDVSTNEEEQFIRSNFPLQLLCHWTPGLKFMFIPTARDQYLPILSMYDEEKEVNSSLLKHKILTFTGTEEKTRELSSGTYYSTRFIFECDGKKYYHEIKNMRLNEICEKNPRTYINGLVYLKDVDTAKELLIGKAVYIQSERARVDDTNNYVGYQEIPLPVNIEATITAIGVGSQAYPVKIIFKDSLERSYYLEVAISRTNSGMDVNNFQAEKRMNYFANAISFTNKKMGNTEALKNKYIGLSVYPKNTLAAKKIALSEGKQTESYVHLPRYMVLTIKGITVSAPKSLAILSLQDKNEAIYKIEVDLKYDIIIKNNNYIEDLLGLEDIRKKYPKITDENWKIISRGELKEGMSTNECRLSIGNPVEIRLKKDTRFETWIYYGRILDFEDGTLQRFK